MKGFSGLGGFLRFKMDLDYITNPIQEEWEDNDDDFIWFKLLILVIFYGLCTVKNIIDFLYIFSLKNNKINWFFKYKYIFYNKIELKYY